MAKTWEPRHERVRRRHERVRRLLMLLDRAGVEASLTGHRGGREARLVRYHAVREWVAELRSLGALPADYKPLPEP